MIPEQAEIEQMLRRERLALTIDRRGEIASECVAMLLIRNKDQLILDATRRADEFFGYIPGELFLKQLAVLLPDDVVSKHDSYVAAYDKEPAVRRMGEGRGELRAKNKQGQILRVEVELIPVIERGERCTVAILMTARSTVKTESESGKQARLRH